MCNVLLAHDSHCGFVHISVTVITINFNLIILSLTQQKKFNFILIQIVIMNRMPLKLHSLLAVQLLFSN